MSRLLVNVAESLNVLKETMGCSLVVRIWGRSAGCWISEMRVQARIALVVGVGMFFTFCVVLCEYAEYSLGYSQFVGELGEVVGIGLEDALVFIGVDEASGCYAVASCFYPCCVVSVE